MTSNFWDSKEKEVQEYDHEPEEYIVFKECRQQHEKEMSEKDANWQRTLIRIINDEIKGMVKVEDVEQIFHDEGMGDFWIEFYMKKIKSLASKDYSRQTKPTFPQTGKGAFRNYSLRKGTKTADTRKGKEKKK